MVSQVREASSRTSGSPSTWALMPSARAIMTGSCCRSCARSLRYLSIDRRTWCCGSDCTARVNFRISTYTLSPTSPSTNDGTHVGDRSVTSLLTVSWLSRTQSTARSTSRSTSAWWCPSSKIRSASRPTGGPHGGVSRCLRTMRLDHGLDVVVVEDLERAADDGGALLGDPVRAAGAGQPGAGLARNVRGRQLLLDHLFGEEIGLHEFAQRGADLVLAARDDRGVRDLDAHGVLEQGRDGEPVREGTDHAALGRGADVFEPRILLLQGERDDEDHGHDDQQRRGPGASSGAAPRPSRRRRSAAERCPGGPSGRAPPGRPAAAGQGSWLSIHLHEPSLAPPRKRTSANVAP